MTKKSLKEIKDISERVPRTIDEALNFEGEDMPMDSMEDVPQEEEPREARAAMDVDKFLDDIRKQSLKGMAQLADDPLSDQYQTLKKVWQIVDKAAEAKQGQAQGQVPGGMLQTRM